MATEIELSTGEHTVKWSKTGYDDLIATINVTDTGVSCVSVDVPGGACYSSTAPGVTIPSSFTVVGHLKKKPTTGVTICDYIDSAGWNALVNDHLLALYYKFIGLDALAENTRLKIPLSKRPSALPDTITNDYLLGTYYYFIGLKSLGNSKTGCNY